MSRKSAILHVKRRLIFVYTCLWVPIKIMSVGLQTFALPGRFKYPKRFTRWVVSGASQHEEQWCSCTQKFMHARWSFWYKRWSIKMKKSQAYSTLLSLSHAEWLRVVKGVLNKTNAKRTAAGIPTWSPTVVLICRSTAYVWQSGRDAQFSADCGRMYSNRQDVRVRIFAKFGQWCPRYQELLDRSSFRPSLSIWKL